MGCSAARGCFRARPYSCFVPTFTFRQGSQHHLPLGAWKWCEGADYARLRSQMRWSAALGSLDNGVSGMHRPPRRHVQRIQRLVECCSTVAGSDGVSSSKKPIIFVPKVSFCPLCGGAMEERVPKGEHELRSICSICGCVHYQNPKMVVGCLVEHDNKVLLCKRKIQPSYGLWTLPAGYMELGESAIEGAKRETMEEAEAAVEPSSLFAHLDIPLIGQSYIIFRAKFKREYFSPGPESLECALFGLNDIPFDEIAFSSINVVLRMYVEDVQAGRVSMHYGVIDKRRGASPSDPQGYVLRNHLVI